MENNNHLVDALIDSKTFTVVGMTLSMLKKQPFYSPIMKEIVKKTSIKKRKLMEVLSSRIREIASIKINRIVIKWWWYYQLLQKGFTWFYPSRSENCEDPISLQDIKEIPSPFYFTFLDHYRYYVIDLRHYKYYIDHQFKNPYTNESFSLKSQSKFHRRVRRLRELGYFNHDETIEKHCLQRALKFRCITLFQTMDFLGYYTCTEWLLLLDVNGLRQWYIDTEDIWNYRAQLSTEQKIRINPGNDSFLVNPSVIVKYRDIYKLQQIILDEIEKLICRGITDSDRRLGCIYVLMGFANMNLTILDAYPWLTSVF